MYFFDTNLSMSNKADIIDKRTCSKIGCNKFESLTKTNSSSNSEVEMRNLLTRAVSGLTVILLLLTPAMVSAGSKHKKLTQNGEGMESRLFRSAVDTKGHFTVDGTQILPHMAISLGLTLDFGFNGWIAPELKDDEAYNRTNIDHYIFSVLMFNLGLADMIVLGLQIPLVIPEGKGWTGIDNNGKYQDAAWNTPGGIGDIALHAKLRWIRADRHAFGLGTVLQYQLPVGKSEMLMGDPGGAASAKLILDVEPRSWYRGAINVGIHYAPGAKSNNHLASRFDDDFNNSGATSTTQWDKAPGGPLLFNYGPMLTFGFGNSLAIVPGIMEAVFEVYGSHLISNLGDMNYLSMEANVGIKVFVERSSYLMAGYAHGIPIAGSRGDNDGYGFQSMEHRMFLGFAFEPSIGDRDGDGIKDDVDQCPDDPEDMDDFEDVDGCPEPDNDRDGILDVNDDCPLVPEDMDGDSDDDGCPERGEGDRDGDGILDEADQCPDNPEDLDQFEDEDGCPDEDNDNDKILDVNDICPNEPEDMDGWEDANGCPDPDNDNDRIPDVDDKCPNEPETYNGNEDTDGCPDQGRVNIIGNQITIMDKVYFEYDSAKIKEVSYDILDAVASTLNGNPQINLIEISGHADERGNDDYNLKLTTDRAASVVTYLVRKGVKSKRLTSMGYGEYCPVEKGSNEAAWEKNRRVEFKILVVEDEPTGVKRGCDTATKKGVVPK